LQSRSSIVGLSDGVENVGKEGENGNAGLEDDREWEREEVEDIEPREWERRWGEEGKEKPGRE
jgi:hypothetical protein